ncbi:uncharacterized protein BYT42DRAFT_589637 [Radiomyces spectabilis]|uniref:uncharacterized protein n=1 Tax=Radiomyces spectabilis TaxID=64574 RepID=UPI0022203039|nr:uncharacterized protein BYT42DRAFT_589637 [Radiomyces spectabilis]KAI8365356.1 hypothetical protein BYT42DRAFT_589637 [Radiomyces spectabilis]
MTWISHHGSCWHVLQECARYAKHGRCTGPAADRKNGYILRLVLPSMGLYVMYELEKVKIPSCLDDLTKLIMDMPRVCRVLETFDRICRPSVNLAMPGRHRSTIRLRRDFFIIPRPQTIMFL